MKEQLCTNPSSPHYRIFPAQPEDNLAEIQNGTVVLFTAARRHIFFIFFFHSRKQETWLC
jgi:hypothetical protein